MLIYIPASEGGKR